MFIIRRQVQAAFERQLAGDFEDRVVAYLRRTYPELLRETPEEAVRHSVREGIRRAATYGITAEYDVVRFVDLMYLLSNDFDSNPQTSWVHPILDDTTTPAGERMDLIHDRASAEKYHLAAPA